MKKRILLILCIIIILFLIILSSAFYLIYIQKLITENTTKNLAELTKQDAIKIENKIEEDIKTLNNICDEILNNNIKTEAEIFNIYDRNSSKSNFTRMGIMYENGETITSDGEIVDLSEDIKYFFGSKDIQVSRSKKSKIDNQEINIYSKCIELNGETVVIMLILETEAYERLFVNSIYSGNGYEYIITAKGEMIANSANQENTKNIYASLKKDIDVKMNQGKIEEMQTDINNKTNGQKILKIYNHNYYFSYAGLDINDWNLLIITPENVIAEELQKVLKISLTIAIVIIFAVIIISAYIIVSNIKIYNLAYIDPITKLGNYNYFCEQGQKILDSASNANKYVIILDVEKFRSFNKHYGHSVGNSLLIEMGNKLNTIIKNEKMICRLSNDIFGVLIKTNYIEKIAKTIFDSLSKIKIKNEQYSLYPVLGIYKCRNNEQILEAIDKASIAHDMVVGDYNKKYCIFDESMESKILEEHQIEEVMYEALENEEFEVYYQPKIDILQEKMVSAEALVRWNRNGKMISPGQFIPLFEKDRFILKLDLYIFEKVCKDIKEWNEEDLSFSINISKEHFDTLDFLKQYEEIANKYQINRKQIELEITESASMDVDLANIMKEIREKGFSISLDDFGTGYSSLNMLQDMPIDVLKIDKSFIDKIGNDKIDIIKYIINMAKDLNIKTVAEGVETEKQIEYLKNVGCNIVQGYYYSKPLNKLEFKKYVKENQDGVKKRGL